jgi:HEAT repeat protein
VSRQGIRRLIFALLVLGVSGAVLYNMRANARLLTSLQSEDEEVAGRSFIELLNRPDRINLVQTLPIPQRQKIALRLAEWNSPEAVRLAGELLQDPEPEVRKTLRDSLVVLARKFPSAYAEQLSATKPEAIAGLIEAAEQAKPEGLIIAEKAFRIKEARENAVRLFLRLGEPAKATLVRLLQSEDPEISLAAAEVLSRMPREKEDATVSKALLSAYQRSEDPESRERLLGTLGVYPSREARSLFENALRNLKTPPHVRIACASALVRLGAEDSVWKMMGDLNTSSILSHPAFFREVGLAFAVDVQNGVQRVLRAPFAPQFKIALLGWNLSPSAESALVDLAQEGADEAFMALMGRPIFRQTTYAFLQRTLLDEKTPPRRRWLSARCLASTPEGQRWLRAIPPAKEGFWIAKVALEEVAPTVAQTP